MITTFTSNDSQKFDTGLYSICNLAIINEKRMSNIEQSLIRIENIVTNLTIMEKIKMSTLDDILAKATNIANLEESVKIVFDNCKREVSDLKQRLADGANSSADAEKMKEIKDRLEKTTSILNAMLAVSANTPAADNIVKPVTPKETLNVITVQDLINSVSEANVQRQKDIEAKAADAALTAANVQASIVDKAIEIAKPASELQRDKVPKAEEQPVISPKIEEQKEDAPKGLTPEPADKNPFGIPLTQKQAIDSIKDTMHKIIED